MHRFTIYLQLPLVLFVSNVYIIYILFPLFCRHFSYKIEWLWYCDCPPIQLKSYFFRSSIVSTWYWRHNGANHIHTRSDLHPLTHQKVDLIDCKDSQARWHLACPFLLMYHVHVKFQYCYEMSPKRELKTKWSQWKWKSIFEIDRIFRKVQIIKLK